MGPNAGMMHVQSNGRGSAVGGQSRRMGSAKGAEGVASFISPSTLLSPETTAAGLPRVEGDRGVQGEGEQELEMEFAKMGVKGEEAVEGKR